MELKRGRLAVSVVVPLRLNRTFYGIETNLLLGYIGIVAVLIVPFMELKHNNDNKE